MGNGATIASKSKCAENELFVTLLERTDLVLTCERLRTYADLRMKFVLYFRQGEWIEDLVACITRAFPETDDTVKLFVSASTKAATLCHRGGDVTRSFEVFEMHLLFLAIALQRFGRSEEMHAWLKGQTRRNNVLLFSSVAMSTKAMLESTLQIAPEDATTSASSLPSVWRKFLESDHTHADCTTEGNISQLNSMPAHFASLDNIRCGPDATQGDSFLRKLTGSTDTACTDCHQSVLPEQTITEQMVRNLCYKSIEYWHYNTDCTKPAVMQKVMCNEDDSLLAFLSREPCWIEELAHFLDEDLDVPLTISRALTMKEAVEQKCPTLSPVIYVNRSFEQAVQDTSRTFYGCDLLQALLHEANTERRALDELRHAFSQGEAAQTTVTFARQADGAVFKDLVTALPVRHAASQEHRLTVVTHCVLTCGPHSKKRVYAESAELIAHLVCALLA